MIHKFEIFTDINDNKTYAYCTYELFRNRGRHREQFRIDLLFTDELSGDRDAKSGVPIYEVSMKQRITSVDEPLGSVLNSPAAVFEFQHKGYDLESILKVIGDTREHRDFLEQVGIHD